jgi:hypothetical protein
MIQIISPTRIEVDGKDAGLPLDYFLTNVAKRDEVKAAFVAWHASHIIAVQEKDADIAKLKARLKAEHAEKLLDLDNDKAALVAEKDALIAAHNAEKAALHEEMAILGTKEEVQIIRRAQERQRKLDQLAALQAELRAESHGEPEPEKP